MRSGGRRKSIAFFIVLGVCLVAGVAALNVGWIILNWRQAGLLIAGIIVFPLIITGVVLNTIFLVREIRRNEQHEAFINAVTHELKTPVASMKLYLQTLQNRPVDDAKRQEFYRVMLQDSDRLQGTIEQVLRAGQLGAKLRRAKSWLRSGCAPNFIIAIPICFQAGSASVSRSPARWRSTPTCWSRTKRSRRSMFPCKRKCWNCSMKSRAGSASRCSSSPTICASPRKSATMSRSCSTAASSNRGRRRKS